jgi:alpha-L-fucosidase
MLGMGRHSTFGLVLIWALVSWVGAKYDPTWDSIDSRPLPSWYDESKIGIFIHWGVFSVPSFGSEWFWWTWQGQKDQKHIDFMKRNYPPNFTYPEFAPQFTAEFYDPNQWADLFQKAGAKYVVLTSKHHEGFTLWPSANSWNWNAMDVGPKRDVLGDLAVAVRGKGLRFGLYHSMFEWFNTLYLQDKASGFKTSLFVDTKTMPELRDIVQKYKPEVIWSDGDWEAVDTYWKSTEFLAWLYNDSPVKDSVVVNDRWGINLTCHHGGFMTCADRFNPGKLQPRKWENAMTIDQNSWGYVRTSKASDYLTIESLLQTLVQTVSFGGNLLVNVGPTHDGRIAPIMEERLLQMGTWLQTNGEAIYGSVPWVNQTDAVTPKLWYTRSSSSPGTFYATFFDWPLNMVLSLGSVPGSNQMTIFQLDPKGQKQVKWSSGKEGIDVQLQLPSSDWGWTLKIVSPTF